MSRRIVITLALIFILVSSALQAQVRQGPPTKLEPFKAPVLDPHAQVVTQSTVTITGRALGSHTVEVIAPTGITTAPVDRGAFSIDVPLIGNRINHLFFTGIYQQNTRTPASTTQVIQDNQAPTVAIEVPQDGDVITTNTIVVAGRVGDLLSGSLGMSVTVNGVPALVDRGTGSNGTFVATGIPLVSDSQNVIQAVATDIVGNQNAHQITITHVTEPKGAQRMVIESGNGQAGLVETELPQPLIVHLTKGDGSDFARKVVTFQVTRNNGTLSNSQGGLRSRFLQLETDTTGRAQVYWTLGSKSGGGTNRVTATSTGILGEARFCASGSANSASLITIGTGSPQKAEVGGPAPEPLRVFVSDGENAVSGIPVVFRVTEGGGLVDGAAMNVAVTDATGHAEVSYILGDIQGQQIVEATFSGNPTNPAVFDIRGIRRVPGNPTTLEGLVLDNAEQPIQGATIEVEIAGQLIATSSTDFDGRFRFDSIASAGLAHLHVQGTSAYHVGGPGGRDVDPGTFPDLMYMIVITQEAKNALPFPVPLPELDPQNQRYFDGTENVEITVAGIDGVKFTMAEGTVVKDPDGNIVSDLWVSLDRVNPDNIPMHLPDGIRPGYAATFQPPGYTYDPPVQVELPNFEGREPGSIISLMSFDHDTERFEVVGTATVSSDGLSIISDPGSGIPHGGWHSPDGRRGPFTGIRNPQVPMPPPCETCCPLGGDGGENGSCDINCAGGVGGGLFGDPVYIATGELVQRAQDLHIKGRGFDFEWKRTYISKFECDTGALGWGWDHSYNLSLEQAGSTMLVRLGIVRPYSFPEGSGRWESEAYFRVLEINKDKTYAMTFANGDRWNFHALDGSPHEGKIASQADRNGNTMSFAYDLNGRLTTITDTLNRDIVLSYTTDDRIETVTDFAGRQIRYDYYGAGDPEGSPGDLKSVTTPAITNTPRGNDYPSGRTTVYTYSKDTGDAALDHNLLTITDPKGQLFVRNVYASTQGEVDFDRVVRQIWGDPGDVIDFYYEALSGYDSVSVGGDRRGGDGTDGGADPPDRNNPFLRVIVNDRVGNVSEHFFDGYNRLASVREYTGRWNPDQPTNSDDLLQGPTVPKLRTEDPDFFYNLRRFNHTSQVQSERDFSGNVTEYIREADLNPRGSQRQAGNIRAIVHLGAEVSIIERREYDEDHGGCCGVNFVTRQIDGKGQETFMEYDNQGNRTRIVHRIAEIEERFEYNQFGQTTARVWPDNGSGYQRRDEYTYYTSGPSLGYRHQEIQDINGEGLTWTYEYDLVGHVTRLVDPRGLDTLYQYNESDELIREISPEVIPGIRYTKDLFYDANGKLVREDVENRDENGDLVLANPWITTITEYEILNNPMAIVRETGNADVPDSQLTGSGLPASEFLTERTLYDANRNVILEIRGEAVEGRDPDNMVGFLLDERDLLFQEIRAPFHPDKSTTQYDYDGNGNLTRTQVGLEGAPSITTLSYDSHDRLVTAVDPMGNVELRTYDRNHNLVSSSKEGELEDMAGAIGNVRLFECAYVYDPMDRVIQKDCAFFDAETQAPLQGGQELGVARTTWEYTDRSAVSRLVNDNSHETQFAYDTIGRLMQTTDAASNSVILQYDGNDNLISITELERSDLGTPDETYVTTYNYDGLNRKIGEINNVGNSMAYAYDSRHNLVLTTDANGNDVRQVFDSADRLVAMARDLDGDGAIESDLDDVVTRQTWDDSWRLTSQIDDNGNATTYEFDSLDRMTTLVYGDATFESYVRDVRDNITRTIDANGTIEDVTYDALDRRIEVAVLPGPGVSDDTMFERYAFDGRSRMVRAEDDDSIVTFSYDSLSRVTEETQNGQAVTSSYDGVGNRLSCVYPGGRTLVSTYDALEHLKTITDTGTGVQVVAYDYVGPSRVQRKTLGNGVVGDFTWDGQPGTQPPGDFGERQVVGTSWLFDPGGVNTPVDQRTYTWDPMGNKTQRKDVRPGGPGFTHDYGYDSAYRLTRTLVTDPMATVMRDTQYTLDGVHNRTEIIGGYDPGFYTMDATQPEPADFQVNQYTTTPFDARECDANGNLARIIRSPGDEDVVTYDYQNRMVEYLEATGERHVYRYDALWRRIEKIVDADDTAATTRFMYDAWTSCEEQDGLEITQATYVFGAAIDEWLEMTRGGSSYFCHSDELGSVMALSSLSLECRHLEYDDFGSPLDASTLSRIGFLVGFGSPWGLGGRRFDEESELYHVRTRHLDPVSGAFTSRDLIGVWGDDSNLGNPRAYVACSPAALRDPFGLCGPRPEFNPPPCFANIDKSGRSTGGKGAEPGPLNSFRPPDPGQNYADALCSVQYLARYTGYGSKLAEWEKCEAKMKARMKEIEDCGEPPKRRKGLPPIERDRPEWRLIRPRPQESNVKYGPVTIRPSPSPPGFAPPIDAEIPGSPAWTKYN